MSEAEVLYRRAIEGMTRVLGPDHPTTVTAIRNLAAVIAVNEGPSAASSSLTGSQDKQDIRKSKKKEVATPAAPPTQEAIDAADRIASEFLAQLDLEEKEKGKKGAKGKGATGQEGQGKKKK